MPQCMALSRRYLFLLVYLAVAWSPKQSAIMPFKKCFTIYL